MDPSIIHAISEVVAPCLAMLVMGAIPTALVFISKHFKLKTRELELEAELHGREARARIQALETRQAAMEGALQAMVQSLLQRNDLAPRSLLETPPADATDEAAPRGLSSIKPQR